MSAVVKCSLCAREISPIDAFQTGTLPSGSKKWECNTGSSICSKIQREKAGAIWRLKNPPPVYRERTTSGNGSQEEQLAEIGRSMSELVESKNQYRDATRRYVPKDEFQRNGETENTTQVIWHLFKKFWTVKRLVPKQRNKRHAE